MKEVISHNHSTRTVIEEGNIVIYDLENGRTLASAPVEDVFFAIWDGAEELPDFSCRMIKNRKNAYLKYLDIIKGENAVRIEPENNITRIRKVEVQRNLVEYKKISMELSGKILGDEVSLDKLLSFADRIFHWITGTYK